MNKSNTLNGIIEELSKQDENQNCFDCSKFFMNFIYYFKIIIVFLFEIEILSWYLIIDKVPAPWASVNNAIFLCLECSGEHRGFGVSVSYIRSINLDTWYEIIN